MTARNENSSLVALRELREMERRRLREEQQARAQVEKQRLEKEQAETRRREERLAREEAERQAAHARETAESTRLRRELDSAHSEMAQLRGQLLASSMALAQAATHAPSTQSVMSTPSRPPGWMVASLGATVLAGVLAVFVAARPETVTVSSPEISAKPALACPPTIQPEPAPPPTVAASLSGKQTSAPVRVNPKHRPAAAGRPHLQGKPASTISCDGTDPLCGIDTAALEDIGKSGRRADKRIPR